MESNSIIMKQIILTSNSAAGLNTKISEHIAEGWKPIGSHQVVVTDIQPQYSGGQLRHTHNTLEYSQTVTKD